MTISTDLTTKERITLANQPITWAGDLSDDCIAHWAGLMLRAEWMDDDFWWWAVYDMQKSEATIDDSNNYTEKFIGGEIARLKAEEIAQVYLTEIVTRQVTADFVIADTIKVTGCELVFAGYTTKGLIEIGDTIEFIAFSTLFQRRIIGVKGITGSEHEKINTELIIKCTNDDEVDILRNWNPDRVTTIIFKKNTRKL